MMRNFTIKLLYTLVFAVFAIAVHAQKLKDVQEESATPPATFKIDGKNKEWEGKFLAHNKKAGIEYTVSNDGKHLYFVIKSISPAENAKLVSGGITIYINPEGSKKEKESATLTYPVIPKLAYRQYAALFNAANDRNGKTFTPAQKDSITSNILRKQLASAREIHITKLKYVADSIISIYNLHSIKAYTSITASNEFFYELAVPIDQLGLKEGKEFAYNIRINGIEAPMMQNMQNQDRPAGNFGGGNFAGRAGAAIGAGNMQANPALSLENLTTPVDFWGKYTLSK